MNKKNKIVFLAGFSMFMCGLGAYLVWPSHSKNGENRSEIESIQLKMEQCVGEICVNKIKIIKTDETSVVEGSITNHGSLDLDSGYIKFRFELDDGRVIVHPYNYPSLKVGEKQSFTFSVPTNSTLLATKYKIVKPTTEDLEMYTQYEK